MERSFCVHMCRGDLCSPAALRFSCSIFCEQGCTFSLARKYQRVTGAADVIMRLQRPRTPAPT